MLRKKALDKGVKKVLKNPFDKKKSQEIKKNEEKPANIEIKFEGKLFYQHQENRVENSKNMHD